MRGNTSNGNMRNQRNNSNRNINCSNNSNDNRNINSSVKHNEKSQQKKVGLNARNEKAKYSDDEIARARYLDSKAKFLVRDRIHNDNIDTRNKWIGISNLEVKDKWDRNGNYTPEILSFDAEIIDRTKQPQYEEYMTEDERHLLTYEVAEGDIEKQRKAERRKHQKVDRPSYHVDVATKHTDKKIEYQVKDIKRKK